MYYSVSAFAKNTSAIGVATNTTLNPKDPAYKWIDHGIVIQSQPNRDMWNAIDPNLVFDYSNTPWLTFGSFWEGLKMVKLNPDLKSIANPQEWHTIAKRKRSFDLPDTNPREMLHSKRHLSLRKKDITIYFFHGICAVEETKARTKS